MNTEADATRAAAEEALAADPSQAQAGAAPSLASRWRSVCSACRQVFGLPDYERYLAHAAANHPGQPVLTREAYCNLAIERRYGGGKDGKGGMRCC